MRENSIVFRLAIFLFLLNLAACQAVTATSTVTPTKHSTMTPFIVPTATSTPTPTEELMIDGQLVLLAGLGAGPYYLEDVVTGTGRPWKTEVSVHRILEWEADGCTLLVEVGVDIAEMDIHGRLLRIIFYQDQIPDKEGIESVPILAPNKSWVAYYIGTGSIEIGPDDKQGSHYEFEELETMSVDGLQGPYRISERGGAWTSAWSPDGLQIAYSDYDLAGRHQLYIARLDGTERRQLTNLHKKVDIFKIIWSPNGKKIALVYDADADHAGDATIVIDLLGGSDPVTLDQIVGWWWRDENTLIAGKQGISLIVLDIITGNIISQSSEWDYRGAYLVGPFGDPDKVGGFSLESGFWVYDTYTGEIIQFPYADPYFVDLAYWVAAPEGFSGESACAK